VCHRCHTYALHDPREGDKRTIATARSVEGSRTAPPRRFTLGPVGLLGSGLRLSPRPCPPRTAPSVRSHGFVTLAIPRRPAVTIPPLSSIPRSAHPAPALRDTLPTATLPLPEPAPFLDVFSPSRRCNFSPSAIYFFVDRRGSHVAPGLRVDHLPFRAPSPFH
jgi:hypothetical protein